MTAKADIWQSLTVWPMGLSRLQAAAYIGVSATLFDEMVKDGRMPKPKRLSDGRIGWFRPALDSAYQALPDDGAPDERDRWDTEL